MAASLGSLVVSLGLDAASFVTGLTKSEAEAKKFAAALDRNIATAATVAGASLVVLGGAAVTAFAAINSLAKQAGNFQDLAEKTGASAEAMAGYAVALAVTNKTSEDLGDFSVKLSKNLAGVEDGTDKAGAALIALGINIKQFKALDPAAQIDALSKALASFNDVGGGKASALEAIAKGGANLLPFLKELNEAGGRQIILTAEQIALADQYSDAQARAKAQLNLYAQVAATQALPAIIALTTAAKEFLKELIDTDSATTDLANGNAIQTWADNGARALAFLVDSVQGVGRAFDFTGKLIGAGVAQLAAVAVGEFSRAREIGREFLADAQKIATSPLFSSKLENAIKNRAAPTATGGNRPSLKFEGADKADATGKAILDGQIKALEAAIAREKDELRARASYLDDYFRDGFLSVADYYAKLQEARDTELANVLRFYDAEIEAQRAFQSRAKTSTEREQASNKIADIQERQNKLLRDAGFEEDKLGRQRNRDAAEYQGQLNELNAKMLELAGNTEAAASIRFDAQNQLLKNRAQASGDTGAVAQIQALKDQEQAVLRLINAQRLYDNTLTQVGIDTARIDLLAQTGAITEIDQLNKRADLARQFIPILVAQADAYQRIADSLAKGPAKDQALLTVQKLRLEIEQLAAATDVLSKKFNDIFAGGVSDAITRLVTETRSWTDALNVAKDAAKQINAQIVKIAADQLSGQLFAKGGPLGGVGDFFAGIFGGKAGGDLLGGAAKATEGATLTTAGSTLALAGTGLTASASALTASAATDSAAITTAASALSLGGTGLTATAELLTASASALTASASAISAGGAGKAASGLSGIFDGIDLTALEGFASGGRPRVGKLSVVGERGPELFIPDTAGTIIPSSELESRRGRRDGNVTVHVHVPEGTSRASANQIAVETGRRVQIAQRKNR